MVVWRNGEDGIYLVTSFVQGSIICFWLLAYDVSTLCAFPRMIFGHYGFKLAHHK